MPIYNYTVANKEGKKLSGTVQAPDEQTARNELNNLGFSILNLEETDKMPEVDKNLTRYVFEAIDKNSKSVTGTIPAENEEETYKKLSQEYDLTVTAIWKDGASDAEIKKARKEGTKTLQTQLIKEAEAVKAKNLESQKEEQFVRTKIEVILKEVNQLIQKFDQELNKAQKKEINKRIDKILRIKQSKNLQYILASAEELLKYIQDQEKEMKEQGYTEKRLDYQIKTRELLNELNKSSKAKSIGEDIVNKIEKWESSHTVKEKQEDLTVSFLNKVLLRIKNFFRTPKQIILIKEQIRAYNKQIWEFIKLYFKEPTPEYKEKVKNSIKTIWNARKKAVHSLKQAKDLSKEKRKVQYAEEKLFLSFLKEVNTLTGWLLAFYLIYYIVSLYLVRDLGYTNLPKGFHVYSSNVFKYILVVIFLLHSSTSIKINFFRNSLIASILIFPIFLFGSILFLLNF